MEQRLRSNVFIYIIEYNRQYDVMRRQCGANFFYIYFLLYSIEWNRQLDAMQQQLRSNVFLYLIEYNRQYDAMRQQLRSSVFLINWVQPSVWRDATADKEKRFCLH